MFCIKGKYGFETYINQNYYSVKVGFHINVSAGDQTADNVGAVNNNNFF